MCKAWVSIPRIVKRKRRKEGQEKEREGEKGKKGSQISVCALCIYLPELLIFERQPLLLLCTVRALPPVKKSSKEMKHHPRLSASSWNTRHSLTRLEDWLREKRAWQEMTTCGLRRRVRVARSEGAGGEVACAKAKELGGMKKCGPFES